MVVTLDGFLLAITTIKLVSELDGCLIREPKGLEVESEWFRNDTLAQPAIPSNGFIS